MSRAAAPTGRAPHSGVHGGDAGPAASLIAPPGCGGGKAAAAALLCVACVRVRPAWGPPRVPLQCGGRGGAAGDGLGVAAASPGVRAGEADGPGTGVPALPAISILPGDSSPRGRGQRASLGRTQPRVSPRPFHFPAVSRGGVGVGRAWRPVGSVFREPTTGPMQGEEGHP